MRRVFAALSVLLMMLSLAACAPDNVIAPPTDTDSVSTKPESVPETTENNNSVQPEQQAVTATVSDEQLTDGARYLKNKKKNDHIRPTADIDGQNILPFKTPQLSGVELSFFTSEDSAFTAGNMDEKQWLSALENEYGLKLNYTVRPNGTLYSSQLIASKAGKTLDIISAKVNDCAAALSLMQSASDIVTLTGSAPVSSRAFELSGGKLFTAKGDCRVLWYNKSLTGDSDPFSLYTKDKWTTDSLMSLCNSVISGGNRLIECDSWLSFGSAGTVQASGISDTGYVMALTDENVIDVYEAFGGVFNKDGAAADGEYSFKAGNTALVFDNTPSAAGFEIGWAPIPKFTADGQYVGELCGSALGLSKTVAEDKKAAAAAFMVLWCARYSERRSDTLIYDLKLTPTETDSYLTFCEAYGGLYNADALIGEVFTSEKMPEQMYGDPDTVYNTFGAAYNRTDVINNRYQ